MKKALLFLFGLATLYLLVQFSPQTGPLGFENSLHKTREGKNTAYNAANGGMELLTGIPMDSLNCKKCHSSTGLYPNGDTINPITYVPSCEDCHDFSQGTTVLEQTCLNCHSRQSSEIAFYPTEDVHRNAGMTCMDCHPKEELHGDDGIYYASCLEDGAIQVACEDCHTPLPSNSSHDTHVDYVSCNACHVVSVVTCVSCHFETNLAIGKTRANTKLKDFKLLVKKNGKVSVGNFSTMGYDGMGNYIISSYHSHVIAKDATDCEDCHFNMGGSNVAIGEYNASGTMTLSTWDAGTKKIIGPSGVIPIPGDWLAAIKQAWATYTDPTEWPSNPDHWEFMTDSTWNAHLYYCEALDGPTMAKLGFTRFPAAIETLDNGVPSVLLLEKNYPNPFSDFTTIRFSIPKTEKVVLTIYNLQGKPIRTLIDKSVSPGTYEVKWDGIGHNGRSVPGGVYYARIQDGKSFQTIKMVLIK
ncbi:MAG: T9SS type A sorting domain-containing protein [Bacteroidia bacterium]|nr:T9SS type A sorting domain-containing protein [Bacteroidia bacterium]